MECYYGNDTVKYTLNIFRFLIYTALYKGLRITDIIFIKLTPVAIKAKIKFIL